MKRVALGQKTFLAAALVLLFCLHHPAAFGTTAASDLIVRDRIAVCGNGTRGPYFVSGYFILVATDTVTVGGHVLRAGSDYTLDYNRAQLRLARPLASTDTAMVSFQRLGFPLPSRVTLAGVDSRSSAGSETDAAGAAWSVTPVSATSTSIPSSAVGSTRWHTPDGLRPAIEWQGYKSFSLSASSQADPNWTQGLELGVEGELAPGLHLNAAVTDRFSAGTGQTALGGDGTRLGNLDRLFVEASSKRFQGRWGEMILDRSDGSAAGRRASGLRLQWHGPSHDIAAVIARPQGQWMRRRLLVRTGDAGPYRLLEDGQSTGIVAGSLTVWLDGSRLTEGADRDYTLDPGRTAIIMSPRLVMTSQSALVVEFERPLDSYARTIVGSSWSWGGEGKRPRSFLSASWEGEDPSSPLFGTLSPAQRAWLAADPSSEVAVPSAERLGSRQGDYRLDTTAAGDSIFVYVGPQNGEWRVPFRYVGPNRGRYRHVAEDVYEFVGSAAGEYDPVAVLTAPISRLAITQSLNLPLGRLGQFDGSWRGVALDRNRFAHGATALGSDHQIGWGIGSIRSDTPTAGLRLDWSHRGSQGDGRDNSLAGGVSFEQSLRRWGLRSRSPDTTHDEYSSALAVPVTSHATLAGEAGVWKGAGTAAWRTSWGGAISPDPRFRARWEWTHRAARSLPSTASSARSEGYSSGVTYSPGRTTFEVVWREASLADPDTLFAVGSAYTSARWVGFGAYGLTFRHKWENGADVVASGRYRSREMSIEAPITALGGAFGSGLVAARGVRSLDGGNYMPYYRGRLSGQWHPLPNATISAEMQLSQVRAGAQREVFIPTRSGQGQYRYERGEYIADPHGDYRRLVVDDPAAVAPAYDGDKRVSVQWYPRLSDWRWSIDLQREIHGRYSTALLRPGHWLQPWEDLAAAMLPGAQLSVRDADRISLRPDRNTQLDLLYSRENSRIGSLAFEKSNADQNLQQRIDGRLRRQLNRLFFIEFGTARDRRRRQGTAWQPLDLHGSVYILSLGLTPGSTISSAVEGRQRVDRAIGQGVRAALWGLRPSAQVRRGGFSLQLQSDLTWVAARLTGRELSALMVEGRPEGFSVTESADLRWQLPGRVTLTANLSGDQRHSTPGWWRMNVEAIARF